MARKDDDFTMTTVRHLLILCLLAALLQMGGTRAMAMSACDEPTMPHHTAPVAPCHGCPLSTLPPGQGGLDAISCCAGTVCPPALTLTPVLPVLARDAAALRHPPVPEALHRLAAPHPDPHPPRVPATL